MRVKALTMGLMCWLIVTKKADGSTSTVYNLRIAETTKHYRFDKHYIYPDIVANTTVGTFRKRRDGTRETLASNLTTFIYSAKTFYVRADFAWARIQQKKAGSTFTKVQTDDLLFSGGFTISPVERLVITFSGLLGIPTHKDLSLENFQFGYAHVGTGAQVDSALNYSRNKRHSIRAAVRLVHFYPRKAPFTINNQVKKVDFNLGNLFDLFVAHHSTWGEHRFEAGYNSTVLWGTRAHPHFPSVVKDIPYIRSTFYSTYKYGFSLCNLPSSLTIGLSEGFDYKPKKTGYKNITTLWLTWDINF
jgi:hypothetical protein